MAYGIYIIQGKKVKKDKIKNILQKKWKEEKASYWCTQARTRKDRERFFFGFCDFMNFFWFFGFIFAVRCLKNRFCFVPFVVPIQYITYSVLTSTKFYPLFKGRDTAIFNCSIYHVFYLGIQHYSANKKYPV